MRFTIGQLAARTGLPVRTIRFWSDSGMVPPVARTESGYRLYDAASLARLELVATLRELGLGLADIHRVLAQETTIGEVAARHVQALDAQMRTLALRRAVLSAVARQQTSTEEITLMNKLARLSAEERGQIIDDFLGEVLETPAEASGMLAQLRDSRPRLPDDPTPEQVDAWVELAELLLDPGFRRGVRALARYTEGRRTGLARVIAQRAGRFGVEPGSAEGAELLHEIMDALPAGTDRVELLTELRIMTEPRAERYWELLGVINGWPPYPSGVPGLEHLRLGMRAHRWVVEAMTAHDLA